MQILQIDEHKVNLDNCSKAQLIGLIKYLAKYAQIPSNKPKKKKLGNIENAFFEEQMRQEHDDIELQWYQNLDY